jgi:hypothetical protein
MARRLELTDATRPRHAINVDGALIHLTATHLPQTYINGATAASAF